MGYSLETQWAVTRIVPSGLFRVSPVFLGGVYGFLGYFQNVFKKSKPVKIAYHVQ
jgi:hypothetical protein